MAKVLSALERNILKAKGMTEVDLKNMAAQGIRSKEDFRTVGDATTLVELIGCGEAVAEKVMRWALVQLAPAPESTPGTEDLPLQALPAPGGNGSSAALLADADVVQCIHCKTRQPKDYKSGDLCPSCGKQAEPVLTCFWCSASGPGKFCRRCGTEFVPTGELELALLLKREGIPKQDISLKLKALSADDKEQLWGRVRRSAHGLG